MIALLGALNIYIYSQIPTGGWRDHLPYNQGVRIAEYNTRIFCATMAGSLFSIDTRDNSLKKHSKANGLSDAAVSAIACSRVTNTLIIGYSNGNIDLIRNDSVVNLPDIKRKTIMGAKGINNIYCKGQYAYLACGFGIVLLDLYRREFSDTYFFGAGGAQVYVNDITTGDNYLYAATREGIFKADLNHPNLLDFNAWQQVQTLPDPDAEYRYVAYYNNQLFTVYQDADLPQDDIITFDDSGWEVWTNSYADRFDYLGEQNGFLVFSSLLKTRVYDPEEELIRDNTTYYAKHALYDSKMNLWYADPGAGLVRLDAAGNGTVIAPNGPPAKTVGDIEILSGQVWIGCGNLESQHAGYGASSFINEQWTSYNRNDLPEMVNFNNVSEISIDPLNPGHVLGGSYGYGVVEFLNGELVDLVDHDDGIFVHVTGYEDKPEYIRITGVDIDRKGNMYASASNSEVGLYKKNPGENWIAMDVEYDDFGFSTNVGQLLVRDGGQIWLLVEEKGILIIEEEEESTRERFFAARNKEGKVLNPIYSIAEDKDGAIWVGTANGPVVYFNPSEIFDEEKILGFQPLIPRNDGTNFYNPLLATEKINDIAIDGANRKWFATEKSGVFLISPDGKKETLHFTEDNSPLLSNNVLTLAVNDVTGEVFFGTDKGIVSYRGGATEGSDDFNDVHVFPNPVRETYQGDVTVTGLVGNVNVKITDITGNLVFETTALGGQAIWNGRNFRGDRVQTGVYLVFCTNEDGSKTHVTKLLFIH